MSKSTLIDTLQRPAIDDSYEIDDTINDVLSTLHKGGDSYNEERDAERDAEPYAEPEAEHTSNFAMTPSSVLSLFANDIKLTILVIIIYVLTSKIPLEKLVYKYISIDKVPFSDVIVKAAIAGILFFVLSRLLI
jgi:hypothetical protein